MPVGQHETWGVKKRGTCYLKKKNMPLGDPFQEPHILAFTNWVATLKVTSLKAGEDGEVVHLSVAFFAPIGDILCIVDILLRGYTIDHVLSGSATVYLCKKI